MRLCHSMSMLSTWTAASLACTRQRATYEYGLMSASQSLAGILRFWAYDGGSNLHCLCRVEHSLVNNAVNRQAAMRSSHALPRPGGRHRPICTGTGEYRATRVSLCNLTAVTLPFRPPTGDSSRRQLLTALPSTAGWSTTYRQHCRLGAASLPPSGPPAVTHERSVHSLSSSAQPSGVS